MRSFIRNFNGRPYIFSRRFKGRGYARKYAGILRANGYNARVVDWVGGSGVFIGRRYNKTPTQARKDWLKESMAGRDDGFGFMDLGGQGFMASLPRLDVGGNFSSAKDATLIPYQEGGFGGIAWKPLPERIRERLEEQEKGYTNPGQTQDEYARIAYSLASDYEGLVSNGSIEPMSMNILSQIPFTQEEAIAVLATDKYSMDLLEDLPFKGLYDEDELEQYMIFKAKEDVEPIIANQIQGATAATFEIGMPKKTNEAAEIWGWGAEPIERKSRGRFADLSSDGGLARWHVVLGFTTDDGYDERPIYAFDTEQKAIDFKNKFEELGAKRGEYFIDSVKMPMGLVDRGERSAIFLPADKVSVEIVKEVASYEDIWKQQQRDMVQMRQSLNNPVELGGALGSNVPGQKAVKEMFEFQEARENEQRRMDEFYAEDYNSGFYGDGEGLDFDEFMQKLGTSADEDLDPDRFLEDFE